MKRFHSRILLVVVVFVIAGCSSTQTEHDLGGSAVASFEFVVELTASSVDFESNSGTYWETLSWSDASSQGLEFWVDQHGVAGREEGLQGAGFVIHFQETSSGVILVSRYGANWTELSFGCDARTPCRYLVTESGVRALSS